MLRPMIHTTGSKQHIVKHGVKLWMLETVVTSREGVLHDDVCRNHKKISAIHKLYTTKEDSESIFMQLTIRKSRKHQRQRYHPSRIPPKPLQPRQHLIHLLLDDRFKAIHARLGEERVQGGPAHAMDGVVDGPDGRVGGAELVAVLDGLVAPVGGVEDGVEVWVRDVEFFGVDADDGALCFGSSSLGQYIPEE